MKNIEKYNEIFKKVFLVQDDALNEDFTILNVDKWDSVAHMGLVAEIEDQFDIMLDPDDIIGFSSYLKGIDILKKYNIEF